MKDLGITKIDIQVKEEDEILDVVALGHALNRMFYGYTSKEEHDES